MSNPSADREFSLEQKPSPALSDPKLHGEQQEPSSPSPRCLSVPVAAKEEPEEASAAAAPGEEAPSEEAPGEEAPGDEGSLTIAFPPHEGSSDPEGEEAEEDLECGEEEAEAAHVNGVSGEAASSEAEAASSPSDRSGGEAADDDVTCGRFRCLVSRPCDFFAFEALPLPSIVDEQSVVQAASWVIFQTVQWITHLPVSRYLA